MTRVTFSPGQGNFQAKFKSATENVTLKNQVSAGSRLDSLSDVNTQSQPDNSILVYDSATDTFVQQALSTIQASNTSVANVSLSGDVATFTRQDGSTFTLNLANISTVQSYIANTNPRIVKFNANGNISGHLLPEANVAYDLGSADRAFRDLYISGNTIFIANNRISTDGNTISFVTDTGENAKIEAGAVTIKDILGDITKDIILKASNGSFKTVSASDETQELITKFEEIEVPGTATISTLVLSNVLGTQYGGTGLNSVTKDGVLVGKSSSALNYISGSSGEVFQVAANGTPTFSDVDGGTF